MGQVDGEQAGSLGLRQRPGARSDALGVPVADGPDLAVPVPVGVEEAVGGLAALEVGDERGGLDEDVRLLLQVAVDDALRERDLVLALRQQRARGGGVQSDVTPARGGLEGAARGEAGLPVRDDDGVGTTGGGDGDTSRLVD